MQLMSIEDVAVYLGDSKRTIYKYIASGDCPPYIRISGKNIKFDRADVDAWLESKKVQPKSSPSKFSPPRHQDTKEF
jgi:excisionase family DNA binding protein